MITIRCSSLPRVIPCPGSLTLEALVAPRVGTEGLEGDGLHLLSAVRMCADLGATPPPDGLPAPDPSWPSLKFSSWVSDFYLRHVQESVPPDWSLEVEVPLSFEYDGFILSGHLDCLAVSPDGKRAKGFDLKTGRVPVSAAEENEQFFGYACNIKRAYPEMECIEFDGVQPNNDPDDGFERVSRMELSGERLELAIPTLERRIKAALADSMTVNTGHVQCAYCSAATQCPALQADRELMKMTLTEQSLAAIKRQPDDKTLADWVIAAKTLDRPMEDAKELAKARIAATGGIEASDGTQISVKITRGSFKIINPVGLWNALAELLPEAKRALAAKWSMTTVKDQLADHMQIPKTSTRGVSAQSVFEEKTAGLIEQGERAVFQYR